MLLEEYYKKRELKRTPEPEGQIKKKIPGNLENLGVILRQITSLFKIVYVNFADSELAPYLERKIGAVTRLDENTIYIHSGLSPREEKLTWLHEALSIYYYQNDILRHDEQIEEETKRIFRSSEVQSLIAKYIKRYKKKI